MPRAAHLDRPKCYACGRVLSDAAAQRSEWSWEFELYDTMGGVEDRETSQHIDDCEGKTLRDLRVAAIQRRLDKENT